MGERVVSDFVAGFIYSSCDSWMPQDVHSALKKCRLDRLLGQVIEEAKSCFAWTIVEGERDRVADARTVVDALAKNVQQVRHVHSVSAQSNL